VGQGQGYRLSVIWSPVARGQPPEAPIHDASRGPLDRPGGPSCGVSAEGLYLYGDIAFAQVPEDLRCGDCQAARR
jgi:hypothetical protein